MKMSDEELVHQDEAVPAKDFDVEERRDHYSFGNWPEVFGLGLTLFVSWLIFAFSG